MLLAYETLTYYGPGAVALVADSGSGAVVAAQPVMAKRTSAAASGLGTANVLRPYRGRAFALVNGGIAELTAQPRKRQRFGLTVSIGGALTQDGVTGAVLEAPIEGGLSLKQALRILLAQAAGNATGLEGVSPEFRAVDGSKVRIAGTYSSGTRTVTTLDGS
jgi:hypothetical protein